MILHDGLVKKDDLYNLLKEHCGKKGEVGSSLAMSLNDVVRMTYRGRLYLTRKRVLVWSAFTKTSVNGYITIEEDE